MKNNMMQLALVVLMSSGFSMLNGMQAPVEPSSPPKTPTHLIPVGLHDEFIQIAAISDAMKQCPPAPRKAPAVPRHINAYVVRDLRPLFVQLETEDVVNGTQA